nr:unnamed protein product [Spirometra erinaceieuropaei]
MTVCANSNVVYRLLSDEQLCATFAVKARRQGEDRSWWFEVPAKVCANLPSNNAKRRSRAKGCRGTSAWITEVDLVHLLAQVERGCRQDCYLPSNRLERLNYALPILHLVLVMVFSILAMIGGMLKSGTLTDFEPYETYPSIYNLPFLRSFIEPFVENKLETLGSDLVSKGMTGLFLSLFGWIASGFPYGILLDIAALWTLAVIVASC